MFDRSMAEGTVLMYFDIGMLADMKIWDTCAASIFTQHKCFNLIRYFVRVPPCPPHPLVIPYQVIRDAYVVV